MDRKTLLSVWDQFRQIHGVTVRAIDAIPGDQLEARPIPNMRSVKELVDHMYVFLRGFPGAVLRGELLEEDCPSHLASLNTPRDLVAYARESFRVADEAVAKIEDKHLEQLVPTFYDRDANGIPHRWIAVVKESIRTVAPRFCARRMVKEYVERMYAPGIERTMQLTR